MSMASYMIVCKVALNIKKQIEHFICNMYVAI